MNTKEINRMFDRMYSLVKDTQHVYEATPAEMRAILRRIEVHYELQIEEEERQKAKPSKIRTRPT